MANSVSYYDYVLMMENSNISISIISISISIISISIISISIISIHSNISEGH